MSKRDLSKESYERASDLARKVPSRISEIRDILSRVRREGDLAFEVQKDLYGLLLAAPDAVAEGEIISAYDQGLADVEREGQLKLERAWRMDLEDDLAFDVLVDGSHGQIIAATRSGPDAKVRSGGVLALRISDGGKVWSYRMKRNWAPWQPTLGEHHLFFTEDYQGDRDMFDSNPSIYALSLTAGEIAWKGSVGSGADVEQLRGVFESLLLANISDSQGCALVAFDSGTGIERWRYPSSYYRMMGKLFLPVGDVLFAQYRERQVGWFSQTGKLRKKIALRFPKKDEGFIDHVHADAGTTYVCVWGMWHDWEKGEAFEEGDSATAIYAVGNEDKSVRWSLRLKEAADVRVQSVFSHGKNVYFCGETFTVVVDKETGEVVKEWPFQVYHVAGRMIFRSSRKDRFSKDPFAFYACSAATGKIRWQRENFDLLAAQSGILVGRVGDDLVLLDEKTGKERASFGSPTPREVQFVTKDSFLVVSRYSSWRESLSLFRIGGEV